MGKGCRRSLLFEVGNSFVYDFQQFSAADQLFSSLDVLPQFAVGFIEGDVLSDAVKYLLMNRRDALTVGVESAADVDCLAGG